MTASQVGFELETVKVPCTTEDLKATFGWLLLEMRSVAKVLRPDERDVLRKIMTHKGPTLTVRGLFPEFKREDESHKTLRRLRATQFVYPKRTGRWEPDEPVAVTPFARMMWDHLGEERLFSPPPIPPIPPNPPKRVTVDARTPAPTQAVVTWDNLVERIRERQKSLAVGPENRQQS
jgi:hypothetical protein